MGGTCHKSRRRIRRACLVYARWRCERSSHPYCADIAVYGPTQPMPRLRALRRLTPTTGWEGTFRCVPMQIPLPATRRQQARAFLPHAPQLSYAQELKRWSAASTVLPSFLGWLGIGRPPSFLPSLAYLAVTLSDFSDTYDPVRVRKEHLRACQNRLTCTPAFRSDPSYKRTTLSHTISAVAPGQQRLLSADFASLPSIPSVHPRL